jgi:hypothetical protein
MLLGQHLTRPSNFSPSPSLRKAHNCPSVPQRVAHRPNTIDLRVTPETEFVKKSYPNRIHPLFDFSLTIARSHLVRDTIVRTPPWLRSGARSHMINSGRCPSNFCRKYQTLGTAPQRHCTASPHLVHNQVLGKLLLPPPPP